ncbi:universal stress protein PHOS34-like [Pecten maximus]|uniref:universal stress protein PHOS34-like n=1 Tax=Pecten maximus TaxID=6579 RepID=UPI001458DBAC|nr:universal stress protein PHOS34-like [Pecten maximus]
MAESELERFNVVVAMDGSEFAKFAFEWYVKNVHRPEFHVVLVHVMSMESAVHNAEWYKPNASPHGYDTILLKNLIEEEKERIRDKLKVFGELLQAAGIEGTVKSIHSEKPGAGIIQAAEECQAKMIVTGCRGLGKLRRTLMGSVSDYIVHHSTVPTMVCRHPDEDHKHGQKSK